MEGRQEGRIEESERKGCRVIGVAASNVFYGVAYCMQGRGQWIETSPETTRKWHLELESGRKGLVQELLRGRDERRDEEEECSIE